MYSTILTRTTGEFQKSRIMCYFIKCVKIYPNQNFKCVVFVEVSYTSLFSTALRFFKNFTQNTNVLKKVYICIFHKKNCGLKDNFSERPLNFCPLL